MERMDNAITYIVLVSQFVPNWRELLAMATPGGVEFHQHILAALDACDFVEVGSDEHLDWQCIPVFGERRGLVVTLRMVI